MSINSSQLTQHRQLFEIRCQLFRFNNYVTRTDSYQLLHVQYKAISTLFFYGRLQRDVDQGEYLCVDDTDREDRNASNLKIAIKNRI